MKIKVLNYVLIVDILTILLLICIAFIPSNTVIRIVLGLPLLLFFPGYVLTEALFVRKRELGELERLGLSLGTSVPIIGFLGLILNFTPWGIRLEPFLVGITAFILLASVIALARRRFKLTAELTLPAWGGDSFQNSLSVILIVGVVGALAVLGYTLALPRVAEKFSDFYVLGYNLKAELFPTDFVMNQGRVTGVSYDGGRTMTGGDQGQVTLGIINHEAQTVSYGVVVQIDGQQIDITYAGKTVSRLDRITLQPEERWEQAIGFAPQKVGDGQKVEFILWQDGIRSDLEPLKLWINVK